MDRETQIRVMLYFATFMASALSAGGAEIKLKVCAVSQGSLVNLGDVAQVTATSEAEAERLKRLELFPSPIAGKTRLLRRRELRELLQLNDIDPTQHHIAGAAVAQIFPPKALPKSAVKPVVAKTPVTPEKVWVVTTKRSLRQGDVIREADVQLVAMEASPRLARAHSEIRSVVGLEFRRSVPAGSVVERTALRRPILVRRSQLITIESHAPGVRVRTEARALGTGSLGDLIEVESLSTRDRYRVRISGPNRATVFASGVVISGSPITPQDQQRR